MKVYLDYAAATPCDWRASLKSFKYNYFNFGNPLSQHDYGFCANKALEESRFLVANIINAKADEIFFCGSGTESINLAILGSANANWGKGKHIITSAIEHHAVLNTMEHLETLGFEVTYLPVDEHGYVQLELIEKHLRADTILVSVMMANNETGVIQPIKKIVEKVKEINSNCLVHADACQAGNWLTIDVKDLGVDLLSLDSSKIYGPKGVGALFIKTGTAIYPVIYGGTQEKNLRAGTHNIAGIVGFAEAFRITQQRYKKDKTKIEKIKNYLLNQLKVMPEVTINSVADESLPHIVNFSISNLPASVAVEILNKQGVCVSAGAACTTGSLRPSHVVLAQTGSMELATTAIRVSFGRGSKLADVKKLIQAMSRLKK